MICRGLRKGRTSNQIDSEDDGFEISLQELGNQVWLVGCSPHQQRSHSPSSYDDTKASSLLSLDKCMNPMTLNYVSQCYLGNQGRLPQAALFSKRHEVCYAPLSLPATGKYRKMIRAPPFLSDLDLVWVCARIKQDSGALYTASHSPRASRMT